MTRLRERGEIDLSNFFTSKKAWSVSAERIEVRGFIGVYVTLHSKMEHKMRSIMMMVDDHGR